LGRIVAVANQKGGVGKTTTAVNLGACLAELGQRVLIVDLDPQGHSTSGLGLDKDEVETTIYDVLIEDVPVDRALLPTAVEGLFLVPATVDLAGAEVELVSALARETKLRRALREQADAFNLILIDCPPSLGLLTINALTAADSVLIPIQCEYFALEGLTQLMNSIRLVQQHLNPDLRLEGVVMTMFDGRTKLSAQVVAEVRKYFKDKVYKTVIPRNIRLSEAPSHGMPINTYDPTSKGAEAYAELAREVINGAG